MTTRPRNVLIITDSKHGGIFHGRLVDHDIDRNTATLEDCRMVVYWIENTIRGVFGLARTGPSAGSRISPAAPSVHIENVSLVIDTTPAADTAWASEPWSS